MVKRGAWEASKPRAREGMSSVMFFASSCRVFGLLQSMLGAILMESVATTG